jgi:hypothetical protein
MKALRHGHCACLNPVPTGDAIHRFTVCNMTGFDLPGTHPVRPVNQALSHY